MVEDVAAMNYADRHVLESLIYLPMLSAVLLMVVPSGQRALIRAIGVGSGALLMVGSAYVLSLIHI